MSVSTFPLEQVFAQRAQEVLPPILGAAQQTQTARFNFTYGFADPALFPREALLSAAAEVLEQDLDGALNYGPSFPGLRDQILMRLQAQGIDATAEQVLVTYGSNQVLSLLPRVFVNPGDVVIVEGPTFVGAVRMFLNGGARLVSVPVDGGGMNIDALEAILLELRRQNATVKFIYTIPTFQNPSGVTMPLERRLRLLALAAEYGVVVVEDDAYGDLRFEGQSEPSLAALDREGLVVRVCTFSKILAPGLRTGWVSARPEIIQRLMMFKAEGGNGPFSTRLVAQFSSHGRLDAHIEQLNAHYRHKRDLMIDAITREFPAGVTFERPQGGFFVWCRLPHGLSATALLAAAEAHDATFLPGTRCYSDDQGDQAIRIAFSYAPTETIPEGIARIGQAMRTLL